MLVVGAVAFITAQVIILHFHNQYLGLGVMVAMMGLFFLYFHIVARKNIMKINEVIARCAPILEQFRAALDALFPSGRSHGYAEQDLHEDLVFCAVQILDAEKKLDVLRNQAHRDIYGLVHCGNFILEWRGKLATTIDSNRKFGVEPNSAHLFAEAKAHIERTDKMLEEKAG